MTKVVSVAALAVVTAAGAAEVAIISYDGGQLDFTVKGSGTVSVVAQADYKYYSDALAGEAWARATSAPLKVKLTGAKAPVTIKFIPPTGQVLEVEIIVFVDGEEKARQTFAY